METARILGRPSGPPNRPTRVGHRASTGRSVARWGFHYPQPPGRSCWRRNGRPFVSSALDGAWPPSSAR